jgi:hypothetical protein
LDDLFGRFLVRPMRATPFSQRSHPRFRRGLRLHTAAEEPTSSLRRRAKLAQPETETAAQRSTASCVSSTESQLGDDPASPRGKTISKARAARPEPGRRWDAHTSREGGLCRDHPVKKR